MAFCVNITMLHVITMVQLTSALTQRLGL